MRDLEIVKPLAVMQGQLFEMSGVKGYDSEIFIKLFMKSSIAKGLDAEFDYMHWAGKEYIFEKFTEENSESLVQGGTIYSNEALYWIGYLYRYWNGYTGESSKMIYKTAGAKTMNSVYYGYHTLDVEMAIDRLKGE